MTDLIVLRQQYDPNRETALEGIGEHHVRKGITSSGRCIVQIASSKYMPDSRPEQNQLPWNPQYLDVDFLSDVTSGCTRTVADNEISRRTVQAVVRAGEPPRVKLRLERPFNDWL